MRGVEGLVSNGEGRWQREAGLGLRTIPSFGFGFACCLFERPYGVRYVFLGRIVYCCCEIGVRGKG